MRNRNIFIIALVTALILLIPLVAMQFTDEVVWTLSDFLIMGTLLFGTGMTYELISRKGGAAYKVALATAVFSGFLLVWVNMAVGIIGDGETPANVLYFGVILVGFLGGFLTRFTAEGLARTLLAMTVAQALVPVIAFLAWKPSFAPSIADVIGINVFFMMLFVGSALLFRHAAHTESR